MVSPVTLYSTIHTPDQLAWSLTYVGGISLSPAFVVMYVMQEVGISWEDALSLVQNRRYCISPNGGFLTQLKVRTWQPWMDIGIYTLDGLTKYSQSYRNMKRSTRPTTLCNRILNNRELCRGGSGTMMMMQMLFGKIRVQPVYGKPYLWPPAETKKRMIANELTEKKRTRTQWKPEHKPLYFLIREGKIYHCRLCLLFSRPSCL